MQTAAGPDIGATAACPAVGRLRQPQQLPAPKLPEPTKKNVKRGSTSCARMHRFQSGRGASNEYSKQGMVKFVTADPNTYQRQDANCRWTNRNGWSRNVIYAAWLHGHARTHFGMSGNPCCSDRASLERRIGPFGAPALMNAEVPGSARNGGLRSRIVDET
jgi:hypothetical protein